MPSIDFWNKYNREGKLHKAISIWRPSKELVDKNNLNLNILNLYIKLFAHFADHAFTWNRRVRNKKLNLIFVSLTSPLRVTKRYADEEPKIPPQD